MSYSSFRGRRGIRHLLITRILLGTWKFFFRSAWGLKLVIIGVIAVLVGLFFPWVSIGTKATYGAFNMLCGGVGWWILLLLANVLIHTFSYDMSQKIQKQNLSIFSIKNLYVGTGVVIILLAIVVYTSLLGAVKIINGEITVMTSTSGLVLTIMGSIFLILGGVAVRQTEEKESYKHVFVHGVEDEDNESYKKILGPSASTTEEGNMKLPI